MRIELSIHEAAKAIALYVKDITCANFTACHVEFRVNSDSTGIIAIVSDPKDCDNSGASG